MFEPTSVRDYLRSAPVSMKPSGAREPEGMFIWVSAPFHATRGNFSPCGSSASLNFTAGRARH
jgi:hypothetical protein